MKKNNLKPCLTKQISNMFNLWCEPGIGSAAKLGQKCRSGSNEKAKRHSNVNNIKYPTTAKTYRALG